MKPSFKYSGGKTREIKHILSRMPFFYSRVIEPFAGGAALAFYLERPAVLGDMRSNVINCYNVMSDAVMFAEILTKIEYWKTLTIEEREKLFYKYRDDEFRNEDPLTKALRWIFVRQQVFSGMDRVNSKTGKMNAPFGWYDKFGSHISKYHHDFLKNAEIYLQSFEKTILLAKENDFIFIDPPYYERNSDYGNGEGHGESEKMHRDLAKSLSATDANWMIVHSDCELYRELYKDHNIDVIDFSYSQNFKGRDNSGSKVKHLYITNY